MQESNWAQISSAVAAGFSAIAAGINVYMVYVQREREAQKKIALKKKVSTALALRLEVIMRELKKIVQNNEIPATIDCNFNKGVPEELIVEALSPEVLTEIYDLWEALNIFQVSCINRKTTIKPDSKDILKVGELYNESERVKNILDNSF